MLTIEELLPQASYRDCRADENFAPLPVAHRRYHYFQNKNIVERIFGSLLLIPASPVIAVCWLLVRLTSPGPGIYRQKRVGLNGRIFYVYKLRTMRQDAEKAGPQWSAKGDPRITRIGSLLRRLHLDELPQLFNVVKGDMVLVGPRPERPEFVQILSEEILGYQRRLIVKPGITGLSQINLPPDTDLRSVERKLLLDLYHIDHANAWLDLRMVLLTALRILCISSDQLTSIMGLNRTHLLVDLPATDAELTPTLLSELLEESRARKEWKEVSAEDALSEAASDPALEVVVPSLPR